MKQAENLTLEAQIAALQVQIEFMMNNQAKGVSPARRLQDVRKKCRERYFGSWKDMSDGKTQYGPEGKTYQDYDAIMDIIRKEAGLLYKYSRGKAMSGMTITSLIREENDLKEYENICESICKNLKEEIVKRTQKLHPV